MSETYKREVTETVQNTGFGNQCAIDGSNFDESSMCNFGHQHGESYLKSRTATFRMVPCGAIPKFVCNICERVMPEGQNICPNGHATGQEYEVEVQEE